jgi:hypothetical protein
MGQKKRRLPWGSRRVVIIVVNDQRGWSLIGFSLAFI